MPPINSGPGPRYAALLQLLRTAETIWNASRLFFAEWDLSPSQFNILNLLRRDGSGLTQVELSRELIMHRSNVTGLVDRLASRRLVERNASQQDRRVWRVRLTPAGEGLVAKILPEYYHLAEELWGTSTPAQAEKMARELAALETEATLIGQKLEGNTKQ